MARFDAPSNDQIHTALALIYLATPAEKRSILATIFACEVAKCVLNSFLSRIDETGLTKRASRMDDTGLG